jgi:peptide/nickel transport system substrate-binding protein
VTDERKLDALVTEYVERRLTRRIFIKRAAAMGVMASSAAAILAACGSSTPSASAAAQSQAAGSAEPSIAPPSAAAAAPKTGGTFIEGYDRDFSPITTNNAAWVDPTQEALLEPLVRHDPAGKITGVLAESWKGNADSSEWRFKVRAGLKFQSGAVCDAAAIVAAFNVERGPTGQHPQWWTQVTNVAAVGDEVVISCNKPYYTFLDSVAVQEFANAYNVATATSAGKDYGVTVVDGTGPFKLAEFIPADHVLANKWAGYAGNPNGWFDNKAGAYLDAVKWVSQKEAANRANDLISGNVMATKRPLPSDLDTLKANTDVVVLESQESSALTFGLNFERTELGFDDVNVRNAISQAIDRKSIVDAVLLGHGTPAYGPFPTKYKLYEPGVEQYNQFDATKAAAALDAAGWVPGSDGIRAKGGVRLSFSITNFTDAVRNQAGDAIVGYLAKVGVEAKMNNVDGATFYSALGDPKIQAFFFQWLWPSPPNLIQVICDSKFRPAPNWEKALVPEVDAAVDQWQFATSEADAMAAAKAIQLATAKNNPTLTIYFPNVVWAHSVKVHGWTPTTTNLYPYYNDVWIDA